LTLAVIIVEEEIELAATIVEDELKLVAPFLPINEHRERATKFESVRAECKRPREKEGLSRAAAARAAAASAAMRAGS
jgi:hypothetical protein